MHQDDLIMFLCRNDQSLSDLRGRIFIGQTLIDGFKLKKDQIEKGTTPAGVITADDLAFEIRNVKRGITSSQDELLKCETENEKLIRELQRRKDNRRLGTADFCKSH